MSQKRETKFFSRSGTSPISELQSWTKILGRVLQYSYFSVISRFPLKTVHPFRNFLAVRPPPTLNKVETRKKFWIHQSRIVIKFDNHVTSQHGGLFKKSGIFSPFFIRDPILFGVNSSGTHGSVRQGHGASHVSKWQMCITRIEVNFLLKVKRLSDFCSEIRYVFFHFVVKFNVLVDFCERCKKSVCLSKVYAFDSACFYCSAQSLNKVHQVFLFSMLFQ